MKFYCSSPNAGRECANPRLCQSWSRCVGYRREPRTWLRLLFAACLLVPAAAAAYALVHSRTAPKPACARGYAETEFGAYRVCLRVRP